MRRCSRADRKVLGSRTTRRTRQAGRARPLLADDVPARHPPVRRHPQEACASAPRSAYRRRPAVGMTFCTPARSATASAEGRGSEVARLPDRGLFSQPAVPSHPASPDSRLKQRLRVAVCELQDSRPVEQPDQSAAAAAALALPSSPFGWSSLQTSTSARPRRRHELLRPHAALCPRR